MLGSEVVDDAEVLTGRTSETAKMYSRVNIIMRRIYRDHNFGFAIERAAIVTEPAIEDLSLGFTADAELVTGEATFQGYDYVVGGWLDVPDRTERYYIYSTDGAAIKIRPPATFTGTEICTWFKNDWIIKRAVSGGDPAGSNYSRGRKFWTSENPEGLGRITDAEFDRLYGAQLDVNAKGPARKMAQLWVERYDGGAVVSDIGIRIYPIPDRREPIHFEYFIVPATIVAGTVIRLGDGNFEDALSFGAAWLTRIDDVDTTREDFKREMEVVVSDLVFRHKDKAGAEQFILGPRDFRRVPVPRFPWQRWL